MQNSNLDYSQLNLAQLIQDAKVEPQILEEKEEKDLSLIKFLMESPFQNLEIEELEGEIRDVNFEV